MKLNNEQNKTVVNGVMLGYLVLVLHILLMIGLGLAVVLIKGLYDFRWLIFFTGIVLIGWSGYVFYRRLKNSNRRFGDLINDPALKDRAIEISLFGGMASVKLGHRDDNIKLISAETEDEMKQLAPPESQPLRELVELNRMLDDGLISREEFLKLKKDII